MYNIEEDEFSLCGNLIYVVTDQGHSSSNYVSDFENFLFIVDLLNGSPISYSKVVFKIFIWLLMSFHLYQ